MKGFAEKKKYDVREECMVIYNVTLFPCCFLVCLMSVLLLPFMSLTPQAPFSHLLGPFLAVFLGHFL